MSDRAPSAGTYLAMKFFFDLNPIEIEAYCSEQSLPRFAARQMLEWVYKHGVTDADAMTNISKGNRQAIARTMQFYTGSVLAHRIAGDGTQKLLVGWPQPCDRNTEPKLSVISDPGARATECVMIPAESRKTACISSQVGCGVGCRFCASGLGGLEGNLRSGQIVEQVHRLAAMKGIERVTNVVFMGMGEPLANFRAVTDAIRTLNAPWGLGISARRITVSTVGLPQAIRKLAEFELPVTLALSLHAPNDDLRRQLIPWAEYATIEELLRACSDYFTRTGREITLEYLLLRNVNDQHEHAMELADLAHTLRSNVNLIQYNEVKGLPFDRPATEDVRVFLETLRTRHVNAHLRASRGRDIAAACGQLRHERGPG